MLAPHGPNALTVLRILLVPAFGAALLQDTGGWDLVAAGIFLFASATDIVDGWLARSQDTVSTFGKVMDPIADKLLVLTALVALVVLDRLAWWVAAVVVVREAAVTIARAQADVVIPAAGWGKLKTGVQIGVILCLIVFDPAPGWLDALVLVMVAVTLISGADFFLTMRRNQAASAVAGDRR